MESRTKCNSRDRRDLRRLHTCLVGDNRYLNRDPDTDADDDLVADPVRGWGADVERVNPGGADNGYDGSGK